VTARAPAGLFSTGFPIVWRHGWPERIVVPEDGAAQRVAFACSFPVVLGHGRAIRILKPQYCAAQGKLIIALRSGLGDFDHDDLNLFAQELCQLWQIQRIDVTAHTDSRTHALIVSC
jgi:hypothetical protein